MSDVSNEVFSGLSCIFLGSIMIVLTIIGRILLNISQALNILVGIN